MSQNPVEHRQLFLPELTVGDVGLDGDKMGDVTDAVFDRGDLLFDIIKLTGFALVDKLGRPRLAVEDRLPELLVERLGLFAGSQDAWVLCDDLTAIVTGLGFEGWVDVDDIAVAIGDYDSTPDVLDGPTEQLEILLALLSFGDIQLEANPVDDLPVVADGRDRHPIPKRRSILAVVAEFNSDRFLVIDGLPYLSDRLLASTRPLQIPTVSAGRFRLGIPG